MTETFVFPARLKRLGLLLLAIGILGVILGFLVYPEHHYSRVWANLLLNSYYTMGIALGAIFFIAIHQLGYGGWHTVIRRIPEAMGYFIPVAGVLLFIVLAGLAFHWHHLYHWAEHGITDPNAPNYDKIIAGKSGYLNIPFYALRIILYVVLWTAAMILLNRISRKEDQIGYQSTYQKSKYRAAFFIVLFGVTSSTASWDLIMSIDPHWYSTLFGWYNLISYVCASVAVMILIVGYLRRTGYLKQVNEEHMHNLGMYMFGFSVFWAYLWFSQFLLIWYGNIPEATAYFSDRMNSSFFYPLFIFLFFINFLAPFLVLMTRKSKRSMSTLTAMAVVVIIGHWLDFYVMIMPGTNIDKHAAHASAGDHGHDGHHDDHDQPDASTEMLSTQLLASNNLLAGDGHDDQGHTDAGHDDHGHAAHGGHDGDHKHKGAGSVEYLPHGENGLGVPEAKMQVVNYAGIFWLELMTFLGFAGLFILVVFTALSRASLIPMNNPYLEESVHTHTLK